MKRKALKFHYIILMAFCQALAFYYFVTPVEAASNEITITCPTEATANTEISCTVTGKTTSLIDTITAELSLSNLTLKSFTPTSEWTNNNSATSTSINIKTSTKKSGSFQIGTIILTSTKSDVSGTAIFDNITFENKEYYYFSAAGQESSIKITAAPVTPTCAADEELANGVCVKKTIICNENEELVDGKCVKKATTCAENEELVDGKCVKKTIACSDDEELVDGKCNKKTTTCTEDEELIDGECVEKTTTCAEDEELIDGECVEKVTKCDEDEKLVDGECVKKTPTCKTNEELKDGKCVEKITTPTCNADEILESNKCVKKQSEPNYLLIGLIAGGSILLIAIIVLLIVFLKKKKSPSSNGYIGASGKGIKTGNVAAPQGFTDEDFKRFGVSGSQTVQTGYAQPATAQPTATPYDNGTFLARSGETIEIGTQPKENTDPRLQMVMKNPNENVEQTAEVSNNPLTSQIGQSSIVKGYDDPKLQYNFSTNQNPTQISQEQSQSNNPLTSQIGQGAALGSYDDPRLQYNFSGNRPIIQTQQPQTQQPQTPIMSAYDIATQAAAQPEQPAQQVIQAATPTTHQTAPIAAPAVQQRPMNIPQQASYQQTRVVPLTAPTDPTVFES